MPIVNIDGNYTQSVDSFLYLGILYSHLTVVVGQRLCATFCSHHHTFLVMCLYKEHHGCITISVQLQKNIENDAITIHRI